MTHTCRECQRTFSTQLELELHRDTCTAGRLFCEQCGERFRECDATRDGWRFVCPNDDCDGEGLDQDLRRVEDFRLVRQ